MKPGDFKINVEGTAYELPAFKVTEKGLQQEGTRHIFFVRGSKDSEDGIEPVPGVTHESLMEMMLHDLKYKNKLVPSRETSLSITALEEALLWQKRRAELRAKAGIQGTYKKSAKSVESK